MNDALPKRSWACAATGTQLRRREEGGATNQQHERVKNGGHEVL
jgi:hypothetical protein